ncbi:50S ribosomal protein L16 [Methanoregula sp.]|uniref:50S ribosomal protein L16 n=1 Tax=Methanoregula sp. TaxID=2052170 RepID=UPI0035696344
MVRKPAKMYRNISKKAYTRRKYMGGVPGSKIVQFEMGNLSQEFPTEVDLIVEEACQIRHSALEAARITANRRLMKEVGRSNFHFKVRVFPHHVLRENKQATGAGADRVSEGMRLAFGKAVGTAARVDPGQKIMTVYSTPQYLEKIKDALRHSGHKLPTPSHLKVSEIKVSGRIIAAPKLVGEKVVAAPVVAEEAAAAEPAKDAKGAAAAPAKGGKDAGKAAAPAAKGGKDAAPAKGGKDAGKAAAPAAKGGKK